MAANLQQAISNLENKVDGMQKQVGQLTTVIESLARIEERLSNQKDDVDGFGQRLERFETRLRDVEIQSTVNSSDGQRVTRWVERIIFFIVIAGLGAANFFKDKS